MKKIHFTAICLLLLGLLLGAGCEGDYLIDFEFTALKVEHAANFGHLPETTNADTIPANAYVLRLFLFPHELSRSGRYADPENPPTNVNPVRDMRITSNRDFDDGHPAGALLNDVFLSFSGNYLDYNSWFSNVDSPYFDTQPVPRHVDLLLISPPTLSREHAFRVELLLEDGTQFIDSTSTIYLN